MAGQELSNLLVTDGARLLGDSSLTALGPAGRPQGVESHCRLSPPRHDFIKCFKRWRAMMELGVEIIAGIRQDARD